MARDRGTNILDPWVKDKGDARWRGIEERIVLTYGTRIRATPDGAVSDAGFLEGSREYAEKFLQFTVINK